MLSDKFMSDSIDNCLLQQFTNLINSFYRWTDRQNTKEKQKIDIKGAEKMSFQERSLHI